MNQLEKKIREKKAHVVVVGIGYVGLPLVVEFARAGYRVTGFDHDVSKVQALRQGKSYIDDVPTADVEAFVKSGHLAASTDENVLGEADCVILCVPTPLKKSKDPDMSYIESAAQAVKRHLKADQLVVLESTTYPGTTREYLADELTKGTGRTVGTDLFLAFSPERVDPGNPRYGTKNTPKVIGGCTKECLAVASALYEGVVDQIVPVSSPDAAEMVKLLENTFRAVNIGLANEFALICERLGLDIWEVIDAAATKPFGFMKFTPGPGLGGHCIPIDPLYLSWKLRSLRMPARFIEVADFVNSLMPERVVDLTQQALNEEGKALSRSTLLVSGVAYKRDISDVRESPAVEVIEGLLRRGASIRYLDPWVPAFREGSLTFESAPLDVPFGDFDAVVIVTDHRNIDYARMTREAKVIVDTRNATRPFAEGARAKIVRL